ncbi:MAG: hypothetical protein AB1744_13705, partial [Candidatus Zixiibacteriota bacterium]
VLLEINPIRVAAELVSAVEGTALGATQGRPLRDEKKVAPYAMRKTTSSLLRQPQNSCPRPAGIVRRTRF